MALDSRGVLGTKWLSQSTGLKILEKLTQCFLKTVTRPDTVPSVLVLYQDKQLTADISEGAKMLELNTILRIICVLKLTE